MKYVIEILVGILFFSAVAILLYFTVFVIEDSIFRKEGKFHISVIFNDVYGLTEGDKVLVAGVQYGKVIKVKLRDDGKVLVKIALKGPIKLFKNYKIVIKSETALGGRIVSILPGDKILGEVSLDKPLKGAVLKDIFELASEVVAENRKNIKSAIENLKIIFAKINTGKGTIGKLINQDKLHKDTEKLINKASTLVDELKDTIEDVREQAPVTSFVRAALTAF